MSDSFLNKPFIVEPLVTEDASSLHRLMASNKKDFQRFFPITLSQNETFEASEVYILSKSEALRSKSEYTFGIKTDKAVVGLIILKKVNWELKRGEIAYCIDKLYQGKGWITRVVKEISAFAFTDLGLKTLEIIVYRENKASVRVAEKCGFEWKKTFLKGYTPRNEEPIDMELYERSYEK
jgi:ribosomal-protein-alanine N-acetyltransferase